MSIFKSPEAGKKKNGQKPEYGWEISCISTSLVKDSRYSEVVKEFIFELPFLNARDCSSVNCTLLPGTERIVTRSILPTPTPHLYSVFLKVALTFVFTVHCPGGNRYFTRELIFPFFCFLALPRRGGFTLLVETTVNFCRCTIISEENNVMQLRGEEPGEQFGFAAAFNSNPFSICTGSPSASKGAVRNAGKVTAFSYYGGNKLFEVFGSGRGDEFGFAVDSADFDLNGDGWSDILAGAPGATVNNAVHAGYVRVLSGLDGSLLLEIPNTEAEAQFGWSVSWAGDLDDDGVPDILVGAPLTSPGGRVNAGSVFAYSGVSGSLIYRLNGQKGGDSFGYSLQSIGDVDGDGVPDFAVGAPFASPDGLYQAGTVYVFSGASGSLIHTIKGSEPNAGLGFSLAAPGDINGDGIPDILAGAPGSSPGGRKEAGSVYIFSGADGNELFHFGGPEAGEEAGVSVSVTGDLDGDGLPDLLVSTPGASPTGWRFAGRVYLVSGSSGRILRVFEGGKTWGQFGWSVGSAGRVNPNLIFSGSPGIDTLDVLQIGRAAKLKCEISLTAVISVLQEANILIPTAACGRTNAFHATSGHGNFSESGSVR